MFRKLLEKTRFYWKNEGKFQKFDKISDNFKKFLIKLPIIKYTPSVYQNTRLFIKAKYKDTFFFLADLIINGLLVTYIIGWTDIQIIPEWLDIILRVGMGLYIITSYVKGGWIAYVKQKHDGKSYVREISK
ncbi:MAG: hypothetical protein AABY22_14045 [Nanoarchaeota archaeon]